MATKTVTNRGPNRAQFSIVRDGAGVPLVHVRIALQGPKEAPAEAFLRPAEVTAALEAAALTSTQLDAICDALYAAALVKEGFA